MYYYTSENTIKKYIRDIRSFFLYLGNNEISKNIVLFWKDKLLKDYAPACINSMIAAINGFLEWIQMADCKVKPVKIQRSFFARPEKELSREEYLKLIRIAKSSQNDCISMVMQTICATGIRVSELQYITVDALRTGRATVDCKGKTRTIFLAKDLCCCLSRYCREQGIDSGVVFRTRGGKPLDRSNIWRAMHLLCENAGVEPGKVFPHNLRHLFARTYYALEKDLSRLADLLGHSNVNTTKIYTMESGMEHVKQMNRMGLVILT